MRWHDDYFTVMAIDPDTFAIGEPRYWQQNFNYLIVGETRAILFDAGPGVRDILPADEAQAALKRRFAIVQTWRSIAPIRTAALSSAGSPS